MTEKKTFRIAVGCPSFESVRFVQGIVLGNVSSRDLNLKCNYCNHWRRGRCDFFLAKR